MRSRVTGITFAIAALAAAGMATAGVAHADPDYTWECDTDTYGHTTCRAEPIPTCAVSQDGQWVVQVPRGSLYPRRTDASAVQRFRPRRCDGFRPRAVSREAAVLPSSGTAPLRHRASSSRRTTTTGTVSMFAPQLAGGVLIFGTLAWGVWHSRRKR
jgi:hypothetical protein